MELPLQVNLNSIVQVKLSKSGKDYYAGYNARKLYPDPDIDGFLNFTLWDLMNIFGPVTRPFVRTPFEKNSITFLEIIP